MSQQTWTPIRGFPDWLISGWMGGKSKMGGSDFGSKKLPISTIYREGVWGVDQ